MVECISGAGQGVLKGRDHYDWTLPGSCRQQHSAVLQAAGRVTSHHLSLGLVMIGVCYSYDLHLDNSLGPGYSQSVLET